jgi:hypothetical protein
MALPITGTWYSRAVPGRRPHRAERPDRCRGGG